MGLLILLLILSERGQSEHSLIVQADTLLHVYTPRVERNVAKKIRDQCNKCLVSWPKTISIYIHSYSEKKKKKKGGGTQSKELVCFSV